MYCKTCGKEIHDEAVVCPGCGCATGERGFPKNDDASSLGYAVLGFFIPVVGLILWLLWKAEYPLRAKSAGKGALISVIVSVVIWLLYIVLAVVVFSAVTIHAMPFLC